MLIPTSAFGASREAVLFPARLFILALLAAAGPIGNVRATTDREFAPDVQLAPFVVNGESLSISVHARTKGDRRYAEAFAEEVIAVAHETLERSTGRGLVIVGRDGEPHPLRVFRRFCELAERGELDPAWATAREQLVAQEAEWQKRFARGAENGAPPLDFDLLTDALPVPLEGIASKLFQVAWGERFDPARMDERFRTLTQADLAADKLADYHWVFYLPPKAATDRALKSILSTVMEHEKMGLMKRAAIRSALIVFRPAVKKAVEGMRKGMLFMTVLRARSNYSPEDIHRLTGAYVQVLMPDFKLNGHSEHARAVEAVEAQKRANAAHAADPFIAPARLSTSSPDDYTSFIGDYGDGRRPTHRFRFHDGHYAWQHRESSPRPFFPAGPRLFVDEHATMTIEFLLDETGAVSGVEERATRRRKTIPRFTAAH